MSVVNPGGSSAAATATPSGAALPASPVDKQEFLLEVDLANGIVWHMRYSSTATKWVFIGGADLFAAVFTSETRAAATYADMATVGPSITVPVAGTYDMTFGAYGTSATINKTWLMALDGAGLTANDTDAAFGVSSTTSTSAESNRAIRGALTAAALTAKYKSGDTTSMTINRRYLRVKPVLLAAT